MHAYSKFELSRRFLCRPHSLASPLREVTLIGGEHTERLAVASSGVHCIGLIKMGTMAAEKGDSTR